MRTAKESVNKSQLDVIYDGDFRRNCTQLTSESHSGSKA